MPRIPSPLSRTFLATFTPLALLVACFAAAGCNAAQDATRAQNVIAAILHIAQAEEPTLPPADAAVLTPWVNLGNTLDAQLASCISSAQAAGSKKSAFLSCFNTFAQGLFSPDELAGLRLLSPAAQAKVQLYATAITVGLNVAIASLGGASVATPTVGAAPQPTSSQLRAFTHQLGY